LTITSGVRVAASYQPTLWESYTSTVKISPVNVSRIEWYVDQVDGQRKEVPQFVIIEGEEEWEIEQILNKRKVQEKNKFLVRWKGFTIKGDIWESRKNLENTGDLL